jgi:hypothetical protein
MADFKMVENRKYNDEEIRYVVSRIHAGWDLDTIAKAFKLDHGEYWAGREFTRKQVTYIRATYKPPPGYVKVSTTSSHRLIADDEFVRMQRRQAVHRAHTRILLVANAGGR